ncbi:LPS export ABC transporter permease LptF [Thermodesulfobacteriota bacterium]
MMCLASGSWLISVLKKTMKLTLYKYIFREVWPTFLASLFASVFIIVSIKMLSVTELIVNRGVNFGHVIRMITFVLPDVINFALPAASLMAVVVAFLRLSADSEIIAFKSSGISIYQMLPPVIALSLLWLVTSLVIGTMAVPWGNKSFRDMAFQIARTQADLAIRERIFCEPFENVVFYVSNFSPRTREMKDVFVIDGRSDTVKSTIVAQKGRLISHPDERVITLHFSDGTISIVGENMDSARSIKFKTYDLNIGLNDIIMAMKRREKDPKELYVGELITRLELTSYGQPERNEILIELLEKFAIPLAVLFMGIVGVPLGTQMKARGRSAGVTVSLLVFFMYYMILAAMRSICETGAISPTIGMWVPPMFLMIACVILIKLSAREISLDILNGMLLLGNPVFGRIAKFIKKVNALLN